MDQDKVQRISFTQELSDNDTESIALRWNERIYDFLTDIHQLTLISRVMSTESYLKRDVSRAEHFLK